MLRGRNAKKTEVFFVSEKAQKIAAEAPRAHDPLATRLRNAVALLANTHVLRGIIELAEFCGFRFILQYQFRLLSATGNANVDERMQDLIRFC